MRTNDEKLAEIKRRESAIRLQRSRRQTAVLSAVSAAAAVLIIITAAAILPDISSAPGSRGISAGYASIFSGSPAIGFILVVALSFALGVCVTLFCLKVRRRGGREKRQ